MVRSPQAMFIIAAIILSSASWSCRSASSGMPTSNAPTTEKPAAAQDSHQKSGEPLGRYAAEATKRKTRGMFIAGERAMSLCFATNSATIDPLNAEQALKDMYRKISALARKDHIFLIAGHADQRGSDGFNDKLSEARAEAVRKTLIDEYNAAADHLLARGYGKRHLVDLSENAIAWQTNRRVELWDLTVNPEPYSTTERKSP